MTLFMIVFPLAVLVPTVYIMWKTRPGQPLPPKPLPPHAKVVIGLDPGFADAVDTMVVAIKNMRTGFIAIGPTFARAADAFQRLGEAIRPEPPKRQSPFKSPYEPTHKQKGQS